MLLGYHVVTLPDVVSTKDLALTYSKDEIISLGDVSVVLILCFLVQGSGEDLLNKVGS